MNFHESNAIGKQGEALVMQYLEASGWLATDCSGHKLFQTLDIDIVASKGDVVRTIDVKTDRHDTGNVFIETVSNDVKGTDGCIYASKADHWFYYFVASDRLLIFSPSEVVDLIENANESQYRVVTHPTTIRNKIVYHSHGLLIPISDIPVIKEVRLKRYLASKNQ